jgi:hypothetical protein
MKKIYLFIFSILASITISAQKINGLVYDEKKQPIAGALVYLDGSSIGVLTNDDGSFEIEVHTKIFTNLIVNHIGYEPFSIKNPFTNSLHTINMVPKANLLSEVTVSKKKIRFKRVDKLKLFREEFLGNTIAAKHCKILNESKIRLTYDTKKRRLVSTSDEPIKIYNSFLGYQIEYRIKDCYIEFEWTSIKSRDILGWKFSGTTYFKDLTTDSTTYAAQRKMSYNASQLQFFRNLSQQTLGDDNFSLLHGSNYCNPDKYFTVMKRENDYIIVVNNEKLKSKDDFIQSFTLEYPGKPDSEVHFLTKTFRIDQFGNYSAHKSISFAGEISKKRIGDLLPLNYAPKK